MFKVSYRTKQMLLFVVLALASNKAFADYRSDAAAISASTNSQSNINESTAQNVVPNYNGANAPQSNYYNNYSAMDSDSHVATQNNDAGKVATSSFNNKGDYNLSYLPKDNSPAISNIDVSSLTRLFTGAYSECQPTTTTNPTLYNTTTCDQYYPAKDNICTINRNIQVENIFNYSCSKDLTYTPKTCTKTLNLGCLAYNNDCPSSRVFNITNGNGVYSYPNLSINTPTVWGNCVYDTQIMTFTIADTAKISEFTFNNVNYNDFVSVKINGTVLFDNIPTIFYGGLFGLIKSCEMGASRNAYPNVSLIPYLVNGNNQIEVKVLIGGSGAAYANFTVKQKCCTSWQENWEEVCP